MSEASLALISAVNPIAMNHKEIADLVGKRPDNVKRTIETLVESGVIHKPQIEVCGRINGLGLKQQEEVYVFKGEQGKRDSIVVVAQLCPEFTAKLVDRWLELEKEKAGRKASSQYAVPQTLSEALMFAAKLAEQNERIAEQRDEAIRTKAQIGERREATACQRNTVLQRLANKAVRERAEMAALLGADKEFASVRSVWRATGMWYGYRRLMHWCDDRDIFDIDCYDPDTDDRTVCYPHKAWLAVYGVDIAKLF